jgi:pyrroline-5-carboxylate reductase
MKICVVGLGNMGKSIFDLLKKSEFKISGFDRSDVADRYLKNCDVFILAVKPQDFGTFCGSVKADLSKKMAISIMTGVSINKISKELKISKVVRVMPNLPLKVGKALSGWKASKSVSSKERLFVKKLLSIFGEQIEVNDEEKLNMITALSGSGPAYFYHLAEILESKALDFGFSKRDAEKIAKNTLIGSAKLLESVNLSAKELREKVTSKGGTTEAALKSLDKNYFSKIFKEALGAANKRAKELNK